MDLKVLEKSRKLLIQVMGETVYDKFIEDGKIEIKHKDNVYELDQDARVYNRTKNQSYCIEPICSSNLPIHDQLAIKYGYLKHKIKHVEKVANKRNLSGFEPPHRNVHGNRIITAGTDDVEYQRPQRASYLDFVNYMEGLAWRRSQICLEETNTNIVTLNNVNSNTNGVVIDIRCPAGSKMTFYGMYSLPEGNDIRTAHVLKLVLSDEDGKEIPFNTQMRLIKHKVCEEIIQIDRPFYGDLNLTRNIENEDRILYKTDDQFYRFRQSIELNSEDHLEIYTYKCERNICAKNTKLSLECDLWRN